MKGNPKKPVTWWPAVGLASVGLGIAGAVIAVAAWGNTQHPDLSAPTPHHASATCANDPLNLGINADAYSAAERAMVARGGGTDALCQGSEHW